MSERLQTLEAGTLRHVVVVQARVDTRDAAGQAIPAWSTFFTTRADVTPLSGSELIQAQQINANADTLVTIRYRAGVTPLHRITHLTRTLEIISVTDRKDQHVALDLACAEVRS